MKTTRQYRSRKGFTLVELLVVIAIIAVLAAMGFAGAQAAINKARKTKARKICVSMDQAVLSFYDENGHLPAMSEETRDKTLTTEDDENQLLTILLGYESEDNEDKENRRGIRYFEAAEAKGGRQRPKDGIRYGEGDSVEGLFDPWGETYQVLLDGDYDETLDDPFSESSSQGKILRGRRVATFTFGRNGEDDGGSRDDVKSW